MKKITPLIEIQNLSKRYSSESLAVDQATFQIFEGETLGLVGESGSGKSTLGRCILALENVEGHVLYKGKNVCKFSRSELFHFRREAQMIYQDPVGALNPRMTLQEIISEPLDIHGLFLKQNRNKYVAGLLERVGLSNSFLSRYPHQLSGGQQQRAVIARALALKPKFIICDEPLSALDVSMQAQIINLLKELQREMNLTYLFISHDLSLVKHITDRIAVMLAGKIVEIAGTRELFIQPKHPFTKELLFFC